MMRNHFTTTLQYTTLILFDESNMKLGRSGSHRAMLFISLLSCNDVSLSTSKIFCLFLNISVSPGPFSSTLHFFGAALSS